MTTEASAQRPDGGLTYKLDKMVQDKALPWMIEHWKLLGVIALGIIYGYDTWKHQSLPIHHEADKRLQAVEIELSGVKSRQSHLQEKVQDIETKSISSDIINLKFDTMNDALREIKETVKELKTLAEARKKTSASSIARRPIGRVDPASMGTAEHVMNQIMRDFLESQPKN